MKLVLTRDTFTPAAVIGQIEICGLHECFTLEPAEHVIPEGSYAVELYPSPRFHKLVPLLRGVPDRSMIEIHIGNRAQDSEGCILVGWTKGVDWIGASSRAFEALVHRIQAAKEPVSIEIKGRQL